MSSVRTNYDDPTGTGEKARWRCPAGHTAWERTNQHIWCHSCAKEIAHNPDADPEWYELVDMKTGETRAFEELKEEWPPLSEVPAY